MDKFNAFSKAQDEVSQPSQATTATNMPPKKRRETKEQMSIMLTPSQKKKLRKMANDLDYSASELIGYWIEQN